MKNNQKKKFKKYGYLHPLLVFCQNKFFKAKLLYFKFKK